MNAIYAIAEDIITEALANDPRTKDLRISRDQGIISMMIPANEEQLKKQTNEDVISGRALTGTKITLRNDPNWEGIIIEARRVKYLVERTRSRSGRGEAGKRFVVNFRACQLLE